MAAEIGQFSLVLALLVAVAQATIPLFGASTNNHVLMAFAQPVAKAQCLFVAMAFAALMATVVVALPLASVDVAIVLVAAVLDARVSSILAILAVLLSRDSDLSDTSIAIVEVEIVCPSTLVVDKAENILALSSLIPCNAMTPNLS